MSFTSSSHQNSPHVPNPPSSTITNSSSFRTSVSESQEILDIICHAKRIVGFLPINVSDVHGIMEEKSISFEDAMIVAIQEFLDLEMKITIEAIQKQNILRVFPPASKPEGWNLLYAEFSSNSITDLIQQHARYLLPGKQMSM